MSAEWPSVLTLLVLLLTAVVRLRLSVGGLSVLGVVVVLVVVMVQLVNAITADERMITKRSQEGLLKLCACLQKWRAWCCYAAVLCCRLCSLSSPFHTLCFRQRVMSFRTRTSNTPRQSPLDQWQQESTMANYWTFDISRRKFKMTATLLVSH